MLSLYCSREIKFTIAIYFQCYHIKRIKYWFSSIHWRHHMTKVVKLKILGEKEKHFKLQCQEFTYVIFIKHLKRNRSTHRFMSYDWVQMIWACLLPSTCSLLPSIILFHIHTILFTSVFLVLRHINMHIKKSFFHIDLPLLLHRLA